jgi:hypothetical protein
MARGATQESRDAKALVVVRPRQQRKGGKTIDGQGSAVVLVRRKK